MFAVGALPEALTARPITSTFRAAGVWPADSAQLFGKPEPVSTSFDAETMDAMFKDKLITARQRIFGV